MMEHSNQALRVLFFIVTFFISSIIASAQESTNTTSLTTAKEVADKFKKVVGYSSSPYQSVQTTTVTKSPATMVKSIELIDFSTETVATINFISPPGTIYRSLITKEKIYSFQEDGSSTELPNSMPSDFLRKEDYTNLHNETVLLSERTVFDGQEVYTLYNETERKIDQLKMIMQIKSFIYFSIKTGLQIGSKVINATTNNGESSISIIYLYLKDYNLVDNKYLLPHQIIQVTGTNAMEQDTSAAITRVYISKKYNVDVDQFKNETFNNPKEALSGKPIVQQHQQNKFPNPEYKDWPCFYIEGKPETWDLEQHAWGATGFVGNKDILDLKILMGTPSGPKISLEGKSSGMVIKSTDRYAFLVSKGEGYARDSSMHVKIYKDKLSDSIYKQLYEQGHQEIIDRHSLLLYELKSENNSRYFIANKKARIPCSVEKLSKTVERVVPTKKLGKGEYVFYYNTRAYTFRIEN